MESNEQILNAIVDELKEIGLKKMAEELDIQYNSPDFIKLDRVELIRKIVESEYVDRANKRLATRLQLGHLKGCPQELSNCVDTAERSYEPEGTIKHLSSLRFVENGMNVCILGASNSGKTYLAKAIGLSACSRYRVEYFCTEELMDSLMFLKRTDKKKFGSRKKHLCSIELLILDDFLLHSFTDEDEIKAIHEILNKRQEVNKSTIVCSQRMPHDWKAQILDDEVAADAIMKRATKHYTVMINLKEEK